MWRQLTRYERGEADGAAAEARLADVTDVPAQLELAAAAAAGRVADAVGRLQAGDLSAGDELDERVQRAVAALERLVRVWDRGAAEDGPHLARHRIRLDWVVGEVALTRGDAEAACERFARAHDVALRHVLRRHAAKSAAFLAAAQMAMGRIEAAERLAVDAAAEAGAIGAEPVHWPACLVSAEAAFRRGDEAAGVRRQRDAARILEGCLLGLPTGLHQEVAASPPASWLLGLDRGDPSAP